MYASSRRNAFPYFFFFFSMMMMMMMTMIMVKSSANGEEEEEVSCRWLTYKEKIQICAHPDVDDVSDAIAKTGRWYDCDALPDLWLELFPKAAEPPPRERSRGEKNYFLDLGAHIGACSLQMLLSTDAFVVSIEANPENFRRLRKTVSNLSDEFKERIKIYNVAASDSIEDVQILRAVGNSGNSVIGKAVKDHAKQDFHDSVSIQAHRLDDILGNVHFSAMKMDVQGYECRALEGMNKIISNMRTIKFEVANRWLLAQGCSDVILFEKLKSFGFDIFRGRAVLDKPIAKDVYDLVAKNRNKNINPETSSWSTSSPSASGDNFRPSRPTLQEYYYNTLTGESTWTMPVYHGYTVAFVDEATGKRFWQHAETGKTTWQSPGDWEEIHVKNRPDQPRYKHRVTNVMTWKKPEYLAWIRVDYDNNENDERASSESVVQNAVPAANARTAAPSKASAARRRREDDAKLNGKTASAESAVNTSVSTIILAAPSGEGTVRRREGAELKDFELSEARLSRYSLFHPRTNGASEGANAWYQNNVEPSITCPQEERIGIHGEGGKWMCNIEALKEKKDCLIYSVGSENDFTWEEEVKRRAPNCEIHTFDHTVANATNKPDDVFFHQWGLTEKDSHRNPRLKSLSEMIKALKHENRRLDVFKIDCEGCEWQTHKTWFTSGVQIVEILVETHHGSESPKPDSNAKQFFAHLHNSGYRIFHKEPNVHHSGGVTLCVEFALRRI